MSTLTKEWLQKTIAELEEERVAVPGAVNEDAANALAAMKLALASLEAKPIGAFHISDQQVGGTTDYIKDGEWPIDDGVIEVYTAPPLPVAVPECFKRLLHHAYGMTMGHDWNKGTMAGHHRTKLCQAVEECRAAMLQGADGALTNEDTITATQFKPVADLYGLTSPTGSETSFTFDAVEARDFIDGGWSCQEYVELERYQDAMLKGKAEPVSQRDELRKGIAAIRNSDIAIDAGKIQAERDSLNSPVIPAGWVACSERMPNDKDYVWCWGRVVGWTEDDGFEAYYDASRNKWWAVTMDGEEPVRKVTHWQPLPSPPAK